MAPVDKSFGWFLLSRAASHDLSIEAGGTRTSLAIRV